MSISKFDAVHALVGGQITQIADGSFVYHDGQTPPTEEEIQTKLSEMINAEPMRLLREERNRRLQETDWWVLPDRTASQEQINYRQSLRNLPSSSSPELNDNGQLSNVTWPTKPE